MNNTTIRSEKVTIDMHICSTLAERRTSGEVYLAAIAPDMELTVVTLDEVSNILTCFDEDDAYLNIPATSLLLSYDPKQVLELSGKRYLTGPVVFVRFNMEGEYVSLTMGDLHCIQEYLEQHSTALMADGKNLNCICLD